MKNRVKKSLLAVGVALLAMSADGQSAEYCKNFPASDVCAGRPQLTVEYVRRASQGTAALRSLLKDPDSLRVDNVFVNANKRGEFKICYEIGAKNSYGGYERNTALLGGKDVVLLSNASCWTNSFTGRRDKHVVDITAEYKARQ